MDFHLTAVPPSCQWLKNEQPVTKRYFSDREKAGIQRPAGLEMPCLLHLATIDLSTEMPGSGLGSIEPVDNLQEPVDNLWIKLMGLWIKRR
ncbi:MAG: hypothetical protein IGQ88_05780 [Gloeomargaritaceae cyanobacterium C42_A2020_066]|nr:hypothetical protein [Gloeomargaritaceae cyanobacterium C42_A2020_066]